MYSGPEHREKLKQDAKDFLFDQNFQEEVQRLIAEKRPKKIPPSLRSLVKMLQIKGIALREDLRSRVMTKTKL